MFATRTRLVGATVLLLWATTAMGGVPEGARTVEILWDRFGVAHVFAGDEEGLFFGYGYAQMHSHGDLVLKLYGESRGRAAEYWGESFLPNDRWVQTNGVPERARRWYVQQTDEFRRCLEAFADGMNAYAARHPDALATDRRQVLPITGVDPLLHAHRIVHFTYMSSAARVAALAKSVATEPDAAGASNAWAIAPSRTESGHALLLMNPHLPWSDWSTYYEIHLVAPALGLNLYGASQVGFPVLRFVFSDVLGFTQTVNNLDGSDLYRLVTRDDGYLFDGVAREFEREEKILRVRQPDGTLRDEPLVVRRSIHGPVVWDRDGVTLALRTVALDRPHLLEQYWRMATARHFAEFEAQVRRLQVPTFNITYADRDGHVFYLYNGTMPRRATGDVRYWAGAVHGATSATLWTDVHDYDELPRLSDPPAGWVQNSNDPPWSSTWPRVLERREFPAYFPADDFNFSFRTIASLQMLRDGGTFSLAGMIADKHSTRLELADRVLDDVFAAVEAHGTPLAKRAADVLRAWDRSTESASRGALLFELWAVRQFGLVPNLRTGFAAPLDPANPFHTPRGLSDPAGAVRILDEAATETERRYGALDAEWGTFRRFRVGASDLPANGADGNLGAFRVMRYASVAEGSSVQRAIFGDTFTACVEFGDTVKAQVLMSYGNASQPQTPHADDQLVLLQQKKLRPALRDRAAIEANLERREEIARP